MANVATKFGLSSGGMFNGAPPPIKLAGRYFIPPHMIIAPSGGGGVNTTGARYYFVPMYIEQTKTFVGAWTFNGGAGDNGDKVKIAAYSESTSGGPGTLAKNFGEVTLTGAAALRTFASSWSASPGWYYLAIVSDNAVNLWSMAPLVSLTAAGYSSAAFATNLLGIPTPVVGASIEASIPASEYVGGTYANFPEATSLTPTTAQLSSVLTPLVGLYT